MIGGCPELVSDSDLTMGLQTLGARCHQSVYGEAESKRVALDLHLECVVEVGELRYEESAGLHTVESLLLLILRQFPLE